MAWPPEIGLHPVILQVPAEQRQLPPRELGALLSRHARHALQLSAQQTGARLGELHKDEHGAPLPVGDLHWSVTHKPGYAAGVVARGRVGIDLEEVRPRSPELVARTVSDDERRLLDEADDALLFGRCWTAKEAALKRLGLGINALDRCAVVEVLDAQRLVLLVDGQRQLVESLCFDGHIASVTAVAAPVRWAVLDADAAS